MQGSVRSGPIGFGKPLLVTHCVVSSFLSVLTAASQAELSCHICHLWWMTSLSSREELKQRTHTRHDGAAQILLDKADWRVFVHPAFHLLPCEGRFSILLHVWHGLLDCCSAAVKLIQRVCVLCVCSFYSDSFVISFHILNIWICLCCHFLWHFSLSQFVISVKV